MTRAHHRLAEIGGHSVFYREAGDPAAPVVVLLHGCHASSFMFRELIPLLADRYHVIAPDHLGFGASDSPTVDEFDYTFDGRADVVDELLGVLGVSRFAMYVHDYGAPVGWRLLLRHPERVTAIVAQNGNTYEEGFVESFWEPVWRAAAAPEATGGGATAAADAALTAERIRWQYTHGVPDPSPIAPDPWLIDTALVSRPGNAGVQRALDIDYPTNRALYPLVHEAFRGRQVPLLAIWGKNDEIFGPDGARAFTTDLPDAQVVLLDGGHFLLESHVDEVAEHVRGFLAAALTDGDAR